MKDRILIVDDDVLVQKYLRRALTNEGYTVSVATTAEHAIRLAAEWHPAVILLDTVLPDADGVTLCEHLRDLTTAIIIAFAAQRDLATCVGSLDRGADDCVTKPFALPELLARIRALLRRYRADGARWLRFADVEVDTLARSASRGGRRLALTPKEFDLLVLFMRQPRRVLDRATIFSDVWPEEVDEVSNTVEVHVHNLREKLHRPGEAPLLHTVRGSGYVLCEPPGLKLRAELQSENPDSHGLPASIR